MGSPPEFIEFEKIARLSRPCIITEKIDGTNGVIHVADDGAVSAGSRTRWITTATDNHGFAAWVLAHETELRDGLGVGTHYGEWWGAGINKRYPGLPKRFSLFNVSRWREKRPDCCDVVPVLYEGLFTTDAVEAALQRLRDLGSVAAPGNMRPEGVVIFHIQGRLLFKKTIEKDEEPKGMRLPAGSPMLPSPEAT